MYVNPEAGMTVPGAHGRSRRESSSGPASVRLDTTRTAGLSALLTDIDAAMVLSWLRRGLWLIVAAGVIGAMAGLAFGTFAPPRYTATVDLIIDPGNLQVVADDVQPSAQQSDAQLLAVESKLRVLTAGTTLADVVAALHLDRDPEFVPASDGGFGKLLGSTPALDPPATIALRALTKRVSASREERSYVATLSVWASTPQKAVSLASAIVAAFKAELAKSDADTVGQVATALDDRLDSLRQAAADATARVEAFKQAHKLVESGGQLTSTISMTQLDTQLLEARARLNDAQAQYQQLAKAGGEGAAGALDSTTMTALRTQYATLKQQVEAMSLTLGPKHPTLVALKSQLAAARQQIDAESNRLVEAAKQSVDRAQASLDALQKQASAAKSAVFTDNAAQAELAQLQSDATAKTAIYQAFLTRAGNLSQRQQINATDVQVITPPVLPDTRSYPPRTVLLIGAGTVAGVLFGAAMAVGLGWLRRMRRRRQFSRYA